MPVPDQHVAEHMVPIYVAYGEERSIMIKTSTTANDILRALAPGKEIESYAILECLYNAFGRVFESRILEEKECLYSKIPQLTAPTGAVMRSTLRVINRSHAVHVFFNTYFRMLTGTPFVQMKFYVERNTSVLAFTYMIKEALGLAPEDDRFWLFGNYGKHVAQLEEESTVLELRKTWENMRSPQFFQYQMLPDKIDDAILGITKCGFMNKISQKGILRRTKKRWFALKGTTLYYYKSPHNLNKPHCIDRIDECRIIYNGGNILKTSFSLDIVHPTQPTVTMSDGSRARVERWVRTLKRCRKTVDVQMPVSTSDLLQQPGQSDSAADLLRAQESGTGSHLMMVRSKSQCEQIMEAQFMNTQSAEQKQLLAELDALITKIRVDGGCLQINGIDIERGFPWIDTIRKLLLASVQLERPDYPKIIVPKVFDTMIKVRQWAVALNDTRIVKPIHEISECTLVDVLNDCMEVAEVYRSSILDPVGLPKGAVISDYENGNSMLKLRKSLADPPEVVSINQEKQKVPEDKVTKVGRFTFAKPNIFAPELDDKAADHQASKVKFASRLDEQRGTNDASSAGMSALNGIAFVAASAGHASAEILSTSRIAMANSKHRIQTSLKSLGGFFGKVASMLALEKDTNTPAPQSQHDGWEEETFKRTSNNAPSREALSVQKDHYDPSEKDIAINDDENIDDYEYTDAVRNDGDAKVIECHPSVESNSMAAGESFGGRAKTPTPPAFASDEYAKVAHGWNSMPISRDSSVPPMMPVSKSPDRVELISDMNEALPESLKEIDEALKPKATPPIESGADERHAVPEKKFKKHNRSFSMGAFMNAREMTVAAAASPVVAASHHHADALSSLASSRAASMHESAHGNDAKSEAEEEGEKTASSLISGLLSALGAPMAAASPSFPSFFPSKTGRQQHGKSRSIGNISMQTYKEPQPGAFNIDSPRPIGRATRVLSEALQLKDPGQQQDSLANASDLPQKSRSSPAENKGHHSRKNSKSNFFKFDPSTSAASSKSATPEAVGGRALITPNQREQHCSSVPLPLYESSAGDTFADARASSASPRHLLSKVCSVKDDRLLKTMMAQERESQEVVDVPLPRANATEEHGHTDSCEKASAGDKKQHCVQMDLQDNAANINNVAATNEPSELYNWSAENDSNNHIGSSLASQRSSAGISRPSSKSPVAFRFAQPVPQATNNHVRRLSLIPLIPDGEDDESMTVDGDDDHEDKEVVVVAEEEKSNDKKSAGGSVNVMADQDKHKMPPKGDLVKRLSFNEHDAKDVKSKTKNLIVVPAKAAAAASILPARPAFLTGNRTASDAGADEKDPLILPKPSHKADEKSLRLRDGDGLSAASPLSQPNGNRRSEASGDNDAVARDTKGERPRAATASPHHSVPLYDAERSLSGSAMDPAESCAICHEDIQHNLGDESEQFVIRTKYTAFHTACLICSKCGAQLTKSSYRACQGKYFCRVECKAAETGKSHAAAANSSNVLDASAKMFVTSSAAKCNFERSASVDQAIVVPKSEPNGRSGWRHAL